jgi:hypothetical protein
MLKDILIALIVAASIPIGQALYFWTKEEVDWLKNKLNLKPNRFVPFMAGILGTLQAFATQTKHFEIVSLLILIAGLVFGSFAISDKDNATKYTIEATASFIVLFLVIYLTENFIV